MNIETLHLIQSGDIENSREIIHNLLLRREVIILRQGKYTVREIIDNIHTFSYKVEVINTDNSFLIDRYKAIEEWSNYLKQI